MVGTQARKNRAALSKIQQLGHLVANHSYSHSAMSTSPDPIGELGSTDQVIAPFVSDSIYLFRAPYGDWASRLPDSLNADYSRYVGPVFWDIGGEGNGRNGSYAADWKCWADGVSVPTCAEGYLRETQARGRGIVLMHDTHSQTVDMVKRLVPLWKARNYRFASLDQLPTLAANIRASGGTPLDDLTPGPIECNVGYRKESFGKGVLCPEGENVLGPFTETMTRSCIAAGGGRACQSMRWHRSLVKSFRGKDTCPQGARLDRNTRYCVEGIHGFGPFPDELVGQCLSQGQSEQVCTSARWNRGFLLNVLRL